MAKTKRHTAPGNDPGSASRGAAVERARKELGDAIAVALRDAGYSINKRNVTLVLRLVIGVASDDAADAALAEASLVALDEWAVDVKQLSPEAIAAITGIEPVGPLAAPSPAKPTVPAATHQRIPLDLIQESTTNPRKTFRALDELADSIRAHDVLQPVLVRPATSWFIDHGMESGKPGFFVMDRRLLTGKGTYDGEMLFFKTREEAERAMPRYELVAGARRFRASKLAGLKDIPAVIRELSDSDVLEIQVIENDQREDVQPMDQAAGYQALIERAGYDVAGIAAKIGRDGSYVYRRLQLLKLIKPFQDLLAAETIGPALAQELAREPEHVQDGIFAENFRSHVLEWRGVMTLTELRREIQTEYRLALSSAPFPLDAELTKTGPCTNCPKHTGANAVLFPDMAGKDHCTDRACFERKTKAHIAAQMKKAEAEWAEKPVQISERSWSDRKIIGSNDYEIVSKAEAKKLQPGQFHPAVVVDGDKPGKTVLVKLKIDPEKQAADQGGGQSTEDRRKELEAQKRKADRLTALHFAVIDEVLAKSSDEADQPLMVELAKMASLDIDGDSASYVAEKMSWDVADEPGWGWLNRMAEKKLPSLPVPRLVRFIRAALLVPHAVADAWNPKTPKELIEAAKAAGVNVEKLRADLAAKEKAAAKEAKAAEKAAGKTEKPVKKGKKKPAAAEPDLSQADPEEADPEEADEFMDMGEDE